MAAVHPAPVQPPQAPYAPPPAGAPSPYGAPPYWAPPRQRPMGAIIGVVVLVVVLVVMVAFVAAITGFGTPVDTFGLALLAPFCVFFIVIIVVVIAVAANAGRSSYLPPPPPIQQPMVPAGMQGPVSLECPNCGAPPVNVDRFGVATCTYCGTRFLVR